MSRENGNICWFHKNLNREAAEELIKQEGQEDGTFLIRESTSAAGDYVLTLLYQGAVCHYQIRRHGEDAFFSIDDKIRILHGLDTLVDFYKQDSHGLVTKLKSFIKKDLPPNHTRSHGMTNLLHRATKGNETLVVKELLKCGYRNLEAKNEFGQTALHLACMHCDENILQLFLDVNITVNVMDAEGNMPLHYACRSKSASFIRTLLDANANIHGRNINNGYVPLHEAAKYGNLPAVKELLAAHAPILPRTKLGEFPIDLAKENKYEEVIDFLENYKLPSAKTFQEQWYHGTLKRDEAVELLMTVAKKYKEKCDKNNTVADTSGHFLVRFSEKNKSSGFVLTLLWNDQVKHYQIGQHSVYLFIDEGPYLPSLEHLVEHFMRFADGLPINLKHPVKPRPKPPLPFISTMPRPSKKAPERVCNSSIPQLPISSSLNFHNTILNADINDRQQSSQTLGSKKKYTGSVFSTLKLSNKKSKLKNLNSNLQKEQQVPVPGSDVEVAQSLFKNFSFSTDFKDDSNIANEVYNVPKNNTAVVENLKVAQDNVDHCFKTLEVKTEAEIEYFTKSDLAIDMERTKKTEKNISMDANGYTPSVDIRVFLDPKAKTTVEDSIEASSVDLRQFGDNPERLNSVLSTESDILSYLNRQNSDTPSSPEILSSGKLSYFIPREFLALHEIIGSGEFGEVYNGFLVQKPELKDTQNMSETRCQVAIKTLRDEHCRTNKKEFLREASVMIRLHHHCIVQLIGISKGETLMMVQELVPLGSMLQYILENRSQINPNYELKLWASQIACGMEYLESQHFVHRDLAARNILLASRHQAKISDFGLSRALDAANECYQASQGGKWPIKWYAPESFTNGIFSHASDVWSFGVTLWEMFSLGEPPYGDVRGVEVISLIEKGERLPKPTVCPDHVYEIMRNCWNHKPKDRPSFRFLTDFFAKDPDYQNICELIKTKHIG